MVTMFKKNPAIFIPICLYTRTFYRKKENMKYIFSKYVQPSEATLILICDDLHAYNLIIRGNCSSVDEAFKKARNQGENLRSMILNVRRQFADVKNIIIAKWIDIAGQNKYIELYQKLKSILGQGKDLADIVNEFVTSYMRKFYWRRVNEETAKWEKRYLLEEISMSIYVTEILGYPRELWENAPNPKFPDPIGYLYEKRPEIVQMLVEKKTLARQLEILEVPKKEIGSVPSIVSVPLG
jgi:tRNA-dependent cyclodipeptide synthase